MSESAQVQQQVDARGEVLHDARHAVVEAQYQGQRLANDLERLRREQKACTGEHGELEEHLDGLEQERREFSEQLSVLVTSIAAQVTDAEESARGVVAEEEILDATQERLVAAKLRLAEASNRLEGSIRERRHHELTLDELQRQKEIATQQRHRRLAQIDQYEATISDAEDEVANIDVALQRQVEEVETLTADLDGAEAAVAKVAECLEAARRSASRLDRDYHAVEIGRREVEVKREAIEERMLTELDLDLGQAYGSYRHARGETTFEPLEREAAETEIDELREMIRKLGNVNLDALVEETQLEERNEELVQQVQDIDTAVTQLQTVIDELARTSRERFEAAFTAIRENFAGPEGMFRTLFGGGRADVMLLPDDNGQIDWLDSGIEVRAKPPGKEPRVISQLSGGEKALAVLQGAPAVSRAESLHHHHAPQAHDADVRSALRRDHAGAGRVEARLRPRGGRVQRWPDLGAGDRAGRDAHRQRIGRARPSHHRDQAGRRPAPPTRGMRRT
jgi:chromosome segregation protein